MGRTPAISLRLQGLINWPSNVRHPFLSAYMKHIFQNYIISEPGIRASTTGIWINLTIFSQPIHPVYGTGKRLTQESIEPDPKLKELKEPINDLMVTSKDENETKVDPAVMVVKKVVGRSDGTRVNGTIKQNTDLKSHPKVLNPVISFNGISLENAQGPLELRIKQLMSGRFLPLKVDASKQVNGGDAQQAVWSEGHFYFSPLSKGAPDHLLAATKTSNTSILEQVQIFKNVPIHLRVNVIENPMLDTQILAQFIARSLKENNRVLPKIFKLLAQSVDA